MFRVSRHLFRVGWIPLKSCEVPVLSALLVCCSGSDVCAEEGVGDSRAALILLDVSPSKTLPLDWGTIKGTYQ